LEPSEQIEFPQLDMDKAISHPGRKIHLGPVAETESIMPILLDSPMDGGHHPLHSGYMKPAAFANQVLAGRQMIRKARPLPLKAGLGEQDPMLRIDEERLPYIAQGDRVKISQMESVPRVDNLQKNDFVRKTQGEGPERIEDKKGTR
jgi:hypothetical protein